ncbi:MAG TPA: TIGR00725 family protein [Anaerolineales bacterium]|nr:TIGR00725 family protein [Anaerolineales bacterium]
MKWFSVIGGSQATSDEVALAEEVGRRLAEADVGIVCGGGAGVMEAACRGAAEAKGLSIGLLPGGSADEGNRWLTASLPTGMGEARNALVVRAGQVVIAIGGGLGTLAEIALALRMGKPVIALRTWTATAPDGAPLPVIAVSSASEVVSAALREAS